MAPSPQCKLCRKYSVAAMLMCKDCLDLVFDYLELYANTALERAYDYAQRNQPTEKEFFYIL